MKPYKNIHFLLKATSKFFFLVALFIMLSQTSIAQCSNPAWSIAKAWNLYVNGEIYSHSDGKDYIVDNAASGRCGQTPSDVGLGAGTGDECWNLHANPCAPAGSVPTITTQAATSVSCESATLNGTLTVAGGSNVTKGFIYGTDETHVNASTSTALVGACLASTHGTVDQTLTTYTRNISGLAASTPYYFKAFGKNTTGESSTVAISFSTSGAGVPTISATDAASLIEATTATSGGNVAASCGSVVTERGICYNTAATPTTAHSKVTAAGTTGTFTSNLTGLLAGTTYYVRAYAINTSGTGYGPEISFTTDNTPSLTTTAASGITCNAFASGGNVTSDNGSAVTARGIVYHTAATPTLANSVITTGAGTGSFTSNASGLAASTTYYIRSYATNGVGTTYGNEINLTTSAAPCVPVLNPTDAATLITRETATSGGNVTSDAGSAITERGVCISTSANPTIANTKFTSAGTTGAFATNITGMYENTTYYVRAYATNVNGTGYGTQISFTTLAYPRYFSRAAVNTWSLTDGGADCACAPGASDHAIVSHDWSNPTYWPLTHPANLAHGYFITINVKKLTVKNGGVAITTGNLVTSNEVTVEPGGIYAHNGSMDLDATAAQAVRFMFNEGTVLVNGSFANNIALNSSNGRFCKFGAFANSPANPGSVNGISDANMNPYILDDGFGLTDICLAAATLPVELINFEAKKQENSVMVSWVTGSEINNDYFEVQASADGKTWENIAIVQGTGNSTVINKYGFVDYDLDSYSIKYYRLKQVDFDGKTAYSSIKPVNINGAEIENISIFPNPVSSVLTIGMNVLSKGKYDMQIVNTLGMAVEKMQIIVSHENQQINILISGLENGMYSIIFMGENGRRYHKSFIKN